ncbi:calcium transporting ATPase [Aspergillus sclerotioniger CBS 115572]|uniref:Calcium-transporting ATPase n=1 Tax=Aspergillus sclerotioniger CBS 115572 TaxID=1450535 RepID=A0A317WJN9_9EURO|nr:calcium transporting ATPase [Aspergillus sclerotioniger CBS 115572]PWY86573.1 calcium transporting ATPase [Aspergillus sclerotioniger CBS 115572]
MFSASGAKEDSLLASDYLSRPSKCLLYDGISLSEALAPDPQYERDFHIDDNKFAFSPGQLNKLLNPKSLAAFYALGGLRGLEHGLQTDLTAGLSVDEGILSERVTFNDARDVSISKLESGRWLLSQNTESVHQGTPTQFADRYRVFGRNDLPEARRKGFFKLLWEAYNDKIIILLTIAAVVSLSLGVYEAVSGQSQVDWIEGVAVCVAILIVVLATAGNDWQKERQFAKLNKRTVDRDVRVIRSGKPIMVHIFDITVGDVLHIEPGDSPPADGVIISCHGIKCDESSATGESDQMEKMSGHDVWNIILHETATEEMDPFIISGSKVLEGLGTYLVTSVGRNSTYGRIMASLRTESDPTPLQVKLSRLASWIGWFGTGAALLLFLVLFFRFLAQLSGSEATPTEKGQEFMDILIVAVTVIVVAIPEGLPLAVTLALAFATTRMLKENNLVRLLRSCETMGNATVICSDKTGTLTQNQMTAVVGFFGSHENFGHMPSDDDQSSPTALEVSSRFPGSFKDILVKSIALNCTAFEEVQENGKQFIGNKTEVALLRFARGYLGMTDLGEEKSNAHIEHVYPFESGRKSMGIVYRTDSGGSRLLVKGAAELVLDMSTQMVATGHTEETDITAEPISKDDHRAISRNIDNYASHSLRTIGLAYRDLSECPSGNSVDHEKGLPSYEQLLHDMTWIGAFGIHDPLRPEVPGAIKKCHSAGVQVKMVTGDNIKTALSIASCCGIRTDDGIVMEGPQFRKLRDEEMDAVLPRLQVLARSSPDDKRLLVQHLKRLGEIVAVTGDGTNDGPALKTADVGFSMGISGTEVAREASSIILLDDNFKSIVTAIAWGRSVNDAVAKFLQFQITVNITAVCLTVITAIYNSSNESVFKAIQLLWLNLIMDTFAALALQVSHILKHIRLWTNTHRATDPPTDKILERPPTPRSAPLFTVTMWKMILGQSIYKLALCFTLYFAGDRILDYDTSIPQKQLELDTIIFNTFVWMQIFNELNCRRLDNNFNIFEGVHRNYWFMVINVLMVGGQVLIIFVGGDAFSVTRLDGVQWAICLGCAVFCIPWAAVLKFLPDHYVAVVLEYTGKAFRMILCPVGKTYRAIALVLSKLKRAIMAQFRCFNGRSRTDEEACNGSVPEES